MGTVGRTLHEIDLICRASRSRRLLIMGAIPILCGGSTLLGFECRQRGFSALLDWLQPSSLAASLPSRAASRSALGPTATENSVSSNDPASQNVESQRSRSGEALVIASHKLQELETELESTRAQLAQTQWDLAIWRQQAVSSGTERDRALQQVDDLTKQLREIFLELGSTQEELEALQLQSKADEEKVKQHQKRAASASN
jgi:hypothetical protein